MGITVEPAGNRFIVRFPFELKDSFKGVFKTAKWDGTAKAWLVTAEAEKRLEQWIDAVSPLISDLEEEAQAELNEKELKMLEYNILNLRSELAKQKEDIRSLSASNALIIEAKDELSALQKQREVQRVAFEREIAESKLALDRVCDVDRIIACFQVMKSTHNAKTSAKRDKFKEAAAVIYQQHCKLLEAGFRCAAMVSLSEMNPNRPDRDVPQDISLIDLLRIEKVVD